VITSTAEQPVTRPDSPTNQRRTENHVSANGHTTTPLQNYKMSTATSSLPKTLDNTSPADHLERSPVDVTTVSDTDEMTELPLPTPHKHQIHVLIIGLSCGCE
jgi:hypothetical protein